MALTEDPLPASLLLLAEALHEFGAYDDAERILAEHRQVIDAADEDPSSPRPNPRAQPLLGPQRLDDALAVYDAALAENTQS